MQKETDTEKVFRAYLNHFKDLIFSSSPRFHESGLPVQLTLLNPGGGVWPDKNAAGVGVQTMDLWYENPARYP